jgi:integrase
LQILRAAKCWGEEEERNYTPLRHVESDVPRAMSPDEQGRWLRTAASRPAWQFVYWYSVLALRTTCSTNELRAIRLADISLTPGIETLQIRREGAKNKFRMRTIPLETEDVHWAARQLIDRARGLGACLPHHYLFPIAEGRENYNPNRPMSESGLKKRWAEVRGAAGLTWLRPYDLRHTAITRMAEAGTPIQVIMAFAGHMTLRMQQHYTAISMMAMRSAARSVWGEKPPAKKQPGSDRKGGENLNRYPGHDAFYTGGRFSA